MSRLITGPTLVLWATLFLGALAPNLFVLAPAYLAGRGQNERDIGIVMGAFNVASLLSMALVGTLISRVGHRGMVAAGCVLIAAGCVLFELAGSAPLPVAANAAARAVQGIGWAWLLVGASALVAETAPEGRLAQALGIAGVLTLVSQAVGPSLGEVLEDLAGWPWVFRAGALGGMAAAAVALALPRVRPGAADGDGNGRGAWPILVANGLAGFGFGAVWSFLSDWSEQAGVGAVSPFFVSYVAAAVSTRLLLGHLPDRLGARRTATPALLVHALALLWLARLGARIDLVGVGLLFGLAHGVHYPALQALVVERSGARSRAIAACIFSFGVGAAVAAFGLGAVAYVSGYATIYVIAAGGAAVAAALVWTRG